MSEVVIIDYHLGNLFSVIQACKEVGIDAVVSNNPEVVSCAKAIILPGVGAFKEAMENIEKLSLMNPIKDRVNSGVPIMGICLGLQLLFSESEEFENCKGLGLIEGTVKRIPKTFKEVNIAVPHVGWNKINIFNQDKYSNSPIKLSNNEEFFYFVHSYHVVPKDNSAVLTTTDYNGFEFCSSVLKNNIFATQFHPEKSSSKGLEIYREWAIQNNLI